jgi:hypothetical protein
MITIDDIHIAVPSYKRAGEVRTLKVCPTAKLYCPQSQYNEYCLHYGDESIIAVPDEQDGNVARKRNYILDHAPSPYLLILDDDVSKIGLWDDGEKIILNSDELLYFIVKWFNIAQDLGCTMWGVNQSDDPLVYNTLRPLSLLAPILGPFNGHLNTEVRYDENIPLKEDYDFWLASIKKYRKTLRVNKAFYIHDHGAMAGGVVSQRTVEREILSSERMAKKWGRLFRAGGGTGGRSDNKNRNLLNAQVRSPIPGC